MQVLTLPFAYNARQRRARWREEHRKSPVTCWTPAGVGGKVCIQTGVAPCAGFIAEEGRTSARKEVLPPNKRCLSKEFYKLCEEHPWF